MYIRVKCVMYAFIMHNEYMISYMTMSPNFETYDVTVQSIQLDTMLSNNA